MPTHYTDPDRANDTWSLPNLETFHVSAAEFTASFEADDGTWMATRAEEALAELPDEDPSEEDIHAALASLAGWYYWICLPGCLPDSDASGPFATEEDALADARDTYGDE
jgi:hypothetical protein